MSSINSLHSRIWTALFVAALAAVPSFNLHAQPPTPVATGDRVRISAPSVSEEPLVGTVLEMEADSCVIDVEGRYRPVALPVASIESVEVYRGQTSWAGTAAAGGALGGAVLGVSLALEACNDWVGCHWNNQNKTVQVTVVAGLGGALLGAGIGAVVGAFSKTDRWEDVPLDGIRVGPAQNAADGFSVSLSLRR